MVQRHKKKQMKILIAEDSKSARYALEMHLTEWGYEVISTKDGHEAWDVLQQVDIPKLAILDWVMPGMDGVDICRRLRQANRRSMLYIILLSSKNTRDDIVFALRAGANDYITKPYEYEELHARIQVGQRVIELQASLDARIRELEKIKNRVEETNEALRQEIGKGKRREDALQESEKKIRAILENIEDGFFEIDLAGNLTFFNDSYQRMLGYPTDELRGMNNRRYLDLDNAKKTYQTFNQVYTTGRNVKGFEYEIIAKDGTKRPVETSVTIKKDLNNQAIGFRGIVRDISERKALELQLQQAQKLESVGQLAAGIAHEINTPMQFLGDNIKFLETAFNELLDIQEKQGCLLEAFLKGQVNEEIIGAFDVKLTRADVRCFKEEIPNALDEALDGVARVSKIVRAMKEFSHPSSSDMIPVDINKAIETTLAIARNEWKYVAEIKTDLDPTLPLVPCMAGEINQVLLNLIINAAHAIKDVVGGKESEKGLITILTSHMNNYLEVRISDTGTGIPKDIKNKIFEPFFSTKEVGNGSGQGLAIAHHVIVKKHQGELTFETEKDKGTTFIVRLPISGNMDDQ